MYKTRNTGTGKGMRETRVIGGMLYSGDCRQIFRGMSPNIPGNVLKHCGGLPQTFWEMLPNIPVFPSIPGNVAKHSGECPQIFRGMSSNIRGNVAKYSGECHQTFRGISTKTPRNARNGLANKTASNA